MASTTSIPAYMSAGVPILQPPHLEGDASLATEILPGPPSLVSIQQSVLKRDPKKPSMAFSYLPPSDPGSTYSGIVHGTLIGNEPDTSRLKPSKTATGRAQRASARQQNGAVSMVDTPADSEGSLGLNLPVDSESFTMVVDDESSMSRSTSSQNIQEGPTTTPSGRPRRKDKGKGKEVEPTTIRIKEEPKTVSLSLPDVQTTNLGNNDDHCSSCRSYGALVYCDGCPRAFHLWCLDPPMETVDEGDSRWFCPSCIIRKHPPRKPPLSFLSCLIQQVDTTIPTEFQLPEDLRTHFRDVATGPKGTYIDASETKQPRLNRHGEQESRDPHRLRDRNGVPILCFRCGMSALPEGLAASVPSAKRARRSLAIANKINVSDAWRGIISCDYCNLHWHLDCLDPPLSTLPPFTKRWMCPNHADRILPPKRRIPKQNAPLLDVTKPRQFNNGNIEIIQPETSRIHSISQVSVDEVLINGRRYRIPERVIVLDFWNKLNAPEHRTERDLNLISGMSSPLTSLSSLDDSEERLLPEFPDSSHDREDLDAAQLLCSLQGQRTGVLHPASLISDGVRKKLVDSAVQTDPEQAVRLQEQAIPPRGRVVKLSKSAATPKLKGTTSKTLAATGSARTAKTNDVAEPSSEPLSLPAKRKRQATTAVQRGLSTRELRSRSKNNLDSSLTSISSRSSVKRGEDSVDGDVPMSAPPTLPPISSVKVRPVHVKVEETDSTFILGESSALEAGPSSQTSTAKKLLARTEPVREVKEKRGRKRKQRDDDLPEFDLVGIPGKVAAEKKGRKPRGPKKAIRTPSHAGLISPLTPAIPVPSATLATASAPPTPSLKIRLPRMNNAVALPVHGNTSTRL